MKSARFLFCLLIALAVASTAVAQEGFPLGRDLVWRLGNFCERRRAQSYDPRPFLGRQDVFRGTRLIPARIPPRSEWRRWTARSGPSTWNMT